MRVFPWVLAGVISAALSVPARAQNNVPDASNNRWAFHALLRMKNDGLLVGCPDGLFRRPGPASRSEMAFAIRATYSNLKNHTDGLQKRIDALRSQVNSGDTSNLKSDLESLRADIVRFRTWDKDVAALRRLADMF